jgi:hypothetical protein
VQPAELIRLAAQNGGAQTIRFNLITRKVRGDGPL